MDLPWNFAITNSQTILETSRVHKEDVACQTIEDVEFVLFKEYRARWQLSIKTKRQPLSSHQVGVSMD